LHLVAVVVFFTTLAVELKPEELAEPLARLLVLQEKPVL